MSRHDLFQKVTDQLLREMICELRRNNEQGAEIASLLERILHAVEPRFPNSLHIQESNMVPLAPGQSPQFTATPVPAGSDLGGVVPTWTSSDPTNAPVTADGLVATVALSASIPLDTSVTLTISATSADGTQTATGSVTFTVVAAPAGFPASFDVAQSA